MYKQSIPHTQAKVSIEYVLYVWYKEFKFAFTKFKYGSYFFKFCHERDSKLLIFWGNEYIFIYFSGAVWLLRTDGNVGEGANQ